MQGSELHESLDPATPIGLPIEQGSGEETERLRRLGLNPDGSIACE
jgi:hypothetical protein